MRYGSKALENFYRVFVNFHFNLPIIGLITELSPD